MLSIRPDWDELKKRFQSFWLRENDTALMSITYIRDNSAYRPAKPPVDSPDELHKWVLDPDRIYNFGDAYQLFIYKIALLKYKKAK